MKKFSIMYGVVYGENYVIALFTSQFRAEAYVRQSTNKKDGLLPKIKSFKVNYEKCIEDSFE